jgi:predicted phage-related endonuclease
MKRLILPAAEWLDARRAGLGSSDAPVLLGLLTYGRTPLQLYHEKRGLIHEDEARENHERFEIGLLLEPAIYRWTERHVARLAPLPDPGHHELCIDDTRDWLRFSPDAWACTEDAGQVPAEFKTAAWFAAADWLEREEPPLHYVVQVQHQLAVSGAPYAYLVALVGGETFRWTRIERDDAFLQTYLAEAEAFWDRVQRGDPPLARGPDKGLLAALRRKQTTTAAIELPPEFLELRDRHDALADQIRALEREKSELEARVSQYLLDHGAAVGLLRDGRSYEYVVQTRAGYTVGPSEFAVLRRKGGRHGASTAARG